MALGRIGLWTFNKIYFMGIFLHVCALGPLAGTQINLHFPFWPSQVHTVLFLANSDFLSKENVYADIAIKIKGTPARKCKSPLSL